MNPDWNLEPNDEERGSCIIEEGKEECFCDEPDWEVYDDAT